MIAADLTFDSSFLDALQQGDSPAEQALYDRFKRPVELVLRARIRAPQLREEAHQEVFLRVFSYFRSGKTLDDPARLPAFLCAVARNTALEVLRANTRETQLFPEIGDRRDPSADPERDVLLGERRSVLRRVMGSLKSADRVVLERVYPQLQDKGSICRDLQIDRDYLRVLAHRARARLRICLGSELEAVVPTR